MTAAFRIAPNPDLESTLPYILSVPDGPTPLVIKANATWPRTGMVYCHRGEWRAQLDIVEETAVRSCVRRGGQPSSSRIGGPTYSV